MRVFPEGDDGCDDDGERVSFIFIGCERREEKTETLFNSTHAHAHESEKSTHSHTYPFRRIFFCFSVSMVGRKYVRNSHISRNADNKIEQKRRTKVVENGVDLISTQQHHQQQKQQQHLTGFYSVLRLVCSFFHSLSFHIQFLFLFLFFK